MFKSAAEALSASLKKLRHERQHELGSQPKIAAKAHLGQRTVGRALKGEVSTTIGSVERLARAFGLEAWQLLHPDIDRARTGKDIAMQQAQQPLPIYEIDRPTLDQLLETFDKLTDTQRKDFLDQMRAAVVANIEAHKHMTGRRFNVLSEDRAAKHLPPAPRKPEK